MIGCIAVVWNGDVEVFVWWFLQIVVDCHRRFVIIGWLWMVMVVKAGLFECVLCERIVVGVVLGQK